MTNSVILLVEDNRQIMNANRRMLELHGYDVRSAATIEEARLGIAEETPDLIILDIMLPDGSGLDFCRQLKSSTRGIPVLFLSVLAENADVVVGLRAGGDDYLSKPYDFEVLLARVEALLRRTRRNGHAGASLRIGPFTVDDTAHRVYRDGKDAMLKPREYALFRLLAETPGVFYQPEVLYRRVWAIKPTGDLRTVYVHISSVRRKLGIGEDGAFRIEHKRGKGYRVVIEDEPPLE